MTMWGRCVLNVHWCLRRLDHALCPGDPMSDNKKAKAKSQNLPRRQRKTKPRNRVSMPSSKQRAKQTASVTAYNTSRKDPTRFSEGRVTSKLHGDGMRFVGTQVLQSAVTTASDSQLWTGTAPAVAITTNAIQLNPDTLNGRLAVYANSYAKYAFRRLTIEYEPFVATSQAGGCALAIVNDPNYFGETTGSYTLIQDIKPSATFPFRERGSISYSYDGEDLWWTEYDGTNGASIRQTVQALILGYPSSSSLGAITMGVFRIHYVIDMYQPINNLSISAHGLDEKEKTLLRDYADKLRQSHCKATVESKESKDSTRPVPLERNERGLQIPTVPATSCSSSSTSLGVTSSSISQGWFRA